MSSVVKPATLARRKSETVTLFVRGLLAPQHEESVIAGSQEGSGWWLCAPIELVPAMPVAVGLGHCFDGTRVQYSRAVTVEIRKSMIDYQVYQET